MYKEKQTSQSYVLDETGSVHMLEYYIFSTSTQSDGPFYGIKVTQYNDDQITSESAAISSNEDRVLRTVQLYAKNFVFPCSLHELVEDIREDS